MDKIILVLLFTIIGSVTKGNAQLRCFTCNNCPDELTNNLVQACGATDDITTTESDDTTTDTTVTIETTVTTETTDPIITQTIPIEPPTTTPQTPEPEITTTTQTTEGDITTPTLPISPPTTTPQVPVSPPGLPNHKYSPIMREVHTVYECYVVRRRVGDGTQVNRGCVATQENEDQTCLAANSGETPEFCSLCSNNECNNGNSSNSAMKYTEISLLLVLSSLVVALAIR